MKREIAIHTDFIRLDALLKLAGLAQTGGHAKIMILEEEVLVNGAICTMRGKKCVVGDEITIDGEQIVLIGVKK